MSLILSATSTTTGTTSSSSTTSSTSTLSDFDSFIQLLANELQYQDPTDPVDTTEYVTQMTQIGALSQLTNIYTAINNAAAYDLIGKEVNYSTTDSSGNTVTGSGTVSSVVISGSSTYLNVDGTTVSYDDIVQVTSA